MKTTKLSITFLILFWILPAYATLTLDELNSKLKQWGSTWTATENHVSRLSIEEKRQMMGAILPEGFGDYFSEKESYWENSELPEAYDWRNVNGVSLASPILNQGRCGSCVAFAATYLLETQMNITRETPFSPWEFSAQHMFACGGGGCQTGWRCSEAASFMTDNGVPDEACFPYVSGAIGEDYSCSQTCSDHSSRSEKAIRYTTPTFFYMSVEAIKKALLKGPLMTSFSVYEDFPFYQSGVYKYTTGDYLGGHAVTIIGWNNQQRAWIVANSWGEDWGEKGFFKISWDDTCGLGSNTYGLEVEKSDGYVTFYGMRDYEVLKGIASLKIKSTYANTTQTEWSLTKQGSSDLIAKGVAKRDEIFSLDTSKFQDGDYLLRATAHHGGGKNISQPRTVYVLNGEFKGTVKIANITQGQIITGKILIDFELDYSPIPMTKLVFKAKHVKSGTEISKFTTNIAKKLTLSWRTQKLEKGEWLLSVEGWAGSLTHVSGSEMKVTIK